MTTTATAQQWVNLDGLAGVQASSEHPGHPASGPVSSPAENEWRAAGPGEQWIRVLFAAPQPIGTLRLVFRERERARTQQFTVRWWSELGANAREWVRQQFVFSPDGATEEVEEYTLNLAAVNGLELRITPDISNATDAVASLAELRLSEPDAPGAVREADRRSPA